MKNIPDGDDRDDANNFPWYYDVVTRARAEPDSSLDSLILLSARIIRDDDSGLAVITEETGEMAEARPEFHINLRDTIVSFMEDNCSQDELDVGGESPGKDEETMTETIKELTNRSGELLEDADKILEGEGDRATSPEVHYPFMQRIDINTIRERRGTADTDHVEKRQAEEELERNSYEFMELEDEEEEREYLAFMQTSNRFIADVGRRLEEVERGEKRKKSTGTNTQLERALDKYEIGDETNKEDDIKLFHVRLAEKKVKFGP